MAFIATEKRGVMAVARAAIQAGTCIVVIPRSLYLWRNHSFWQGTGVLEMIEQVHTLWRKNSSKIQAGESAPFLLMWADVELALLLLAAKSMKGSAWREYLEALLPAPLSMPLAWDALEVAQAAKGTQFARAHECLSSEVKSAWEQAVAPILCHRRGHQQGNVCGLPPNECSPQQQEMLFRYCVMIVLSHAFGGNDDHDTIDAVANAAATKEQGDGSCANVGCASDYQGSEPGLIPVADLFNGLPEGHNSVEVSEVQLADPTRIGAPAEWATIVCATRDIKAGEELLNSYGALSPPFFLLKYGVVDRRLIGANLDEAKFFHALNPKHLV
eukprot:SAG31_NODE_4017_length_3662_cov_2.917485_3_plen_329_part_00